MKGKTQWICARFGMSGGQGQGEERMVVTGDISPSESKGWDMSLNGFVPSLVEQTTKKRV